MSTICITSQKGGCGKTVTATNLAAGLARAGASVLLVDLDPQAPVAPSLGLEVPPEALPLADAVRLRRLDAIVQPTRTPGLFVAPGDVSLDHQALANEPLRDTVLQRALRPLVARFDYILLDTPPSLDLVTLNAVMTADWLLLPCDADRESLQSLTRTLAVAFEYVRFRPEVDPDIFYRVLVTMYDHRDQIVNGWLEGQLTMLATPPFRTRIHRATVFKKARANGLSIFDYAGRGCLRGKAALRAVEEFESLTREVMEHEDERRNRGPRPHAANAG